MEQELYHHGILGQKWGKRNGPPYPLKNSAHSKNEKNENWKKSLGGERNEELYRRNIKKQSGIFSKETLKKIKIGKRFSREDIAQRKLEEIRNSKKGPIDEKTGFHLKTKNMTAEEDIKHVNPVHSNSNNTNNNCVYCSATYEVRRRGYDVTANLSSKPMNGRAEIHKMFPKAKVNNIDPYNLISKNGSSINPQIGDLNKAKKYEDLASNGDNREYAKIVINNLSKEKNSRGCLHVSWGFGGGHAINYEVKNGNVRIFDGQNGKIYSGKSVEDILSSTYMVASMRLDNVDFDTKKVKGAMR